MDRKWLPEYVLSAIIKRPTQKKRFINRRVKKKINKKVKTSKQKQESLPAIENNMFSELNAYIEKSESAYSLNDRYKKGDIVFRLQKIAKNGGDYILKYSLNNNDDREFFISNVKLFKDGMPIKSDFYMPFSCEIYH